ncbi:MAG: HD domain-containing protein [Planctomycetota bacterium]
MSRRFVNQLSDGETVDQIFLASEKQLRTNRNGNLYLQVRLSDKTGSVTAMLWNAHQSHFDGFDNGDYVHVQGASQLYNGNMQILAKQVKKSTDPNIDEADFLTLSNTELETMLARIVEILRGVSDPHLQNLVDAFLIDEAFMKQFRAAPAGIKNHHAYLGGLAEHVLSLLELCLVVGPRYPKLNLDLLLVGAFVHDIGKIRELTYSPDLGYSTSGQLIGHLVQGVQVVDEMISKVESQTGESFPADLADQIRHMVVSHHGTLEFGSPKMPMTLEALALHYLDTLDAKVHHFEKLIEEDPNKESRWTVYHPNIGRKIFKG